jgi:hypothetical protein
VGGVPENDPVAGEVTCYSCFSHLHVSEHERLKFPIRYGVSGDKSVKSC